MIFKSIELWNFRQFKHTKIEFSTDSKKNVTFITGEITSGKSTLIKSFLWCLYRDVSTFDDKTLLSQLEKEVMVMGKDKQVKVEIYLEHEEFEYKIVTSESYFIDKASNIGIREKATTKLIKITPNGLASTLSDESADLEINDILKKDLSPYFFIDGETSNIEQLVETRNIKQAISDIMGLKPIETLKKLTNETTKDGVYQNMQQGLVSSNNELLDKIKFERNILIQDKEELEAEVKNRETENLKLIDQKNEIIKIIESNKDVEADVEEKSRLVRKLNHLYSTISNEYGTVVNAVNSTFKFFPIFFSNIFSNFKLNQLLASSNLISEKSLTDIDANAIDQLIKRGYCICGEKIHLNSSHIKHLNDQKDFIAPRNYGKAIEEFLLDLKDDQKKGEDYKESFYRQRDELVDLLNQLNIAKEAISEIDKRIRNRPDVSNYKENLKNIESEIFNNEKIIENKLGKIEEKNNTIKKNNEEITKLTVNTSGNELINRKLAYIIDINKRTNAYLASKAKNVLTTLNKYVSEAFEAMFNGERLIEIDDNYRVKTYLKNGKIDLDESSGLKTVKNFSFVSGLIKCSKDMSSKKDDINENFDGKFPLVMDAPFSKLGEDPIIKVSKQIPLMCDQIIIFVLNKDFQISRKSMGSRVGKQYQIKKLSLGKESIIEEI